MNITTLSQIQFAVTSIYHFFFVPLTLGLSILIAIMETIYVITGDELYKKMTKFWGKLFLINFSMGVVTGIVMEFQFGMNWSEYSRFVGDIFGAPLAIEALLAFFLESTFLGIWLFGWNKLSKPLHATTIWLVAIASNLSALWILIANSFMQHPVGYILDNGKAVMNDFMALISNPYVWGQFPHTVFSGLTTAAIFVLGISTYHLLKKNHIDLFKKSFLIATYAAIAATFLVILFGDLQAKKMARLVPMKLAAAEALMVDEDPASMSIFTIVDQQTLEPSIDIRIPYVTSFLTYSKFSGEVRGIKSLQAEYEDTYGPDNYIPSIFLSYWSFRIMVGAGFALFAIAAYAVFLIFTKREIDQIRIPKTKYPLSIIFLLAIILPYLANSAGWILTEVGRQPWIVFGLMKTNEAVSPSLTNQMVLTSLIGFALIYGLLIIADVHLLTRYAKAGPVEDEDSADNQSLSI